MGNAWLVLASAKLPPTPHAFIRAHFYFGSGFVSGGGNLFQAVQDNNFGYAIRTRMDPWDSVVADGMQPGLGFEESAANGGSQTDSASQTPYAIPLNNWFCTELEIDQNATPTKPGVVHTYYNTDGTPEPAAIDVTVYAQGGPPDPSPAAAPTQTWIQEIDIGPYFNNVMPPGTAVTGDMWIDDIGISTARIGCTD